MTGTPLVPPRLRDDCFAMPQGVSWVPVDTALARLRAVLTPMTGVESVTAIDASGRVLAADCIARRSNPPRPNSAVDGYGFAHSATGRGVQRLPLVAGRAAAGQPFDGAVPAGSAIRILTGAILPDGVDTVVLEEDCASDGRIVVFDGPVKPRANTRTAGEDVKQGEIALTSGHRLRPPDLALLSALGIAAVTVFRPLRVGVLSTGDEIIGDPSQDAAPHQIFDANRPMLLALAQSLGCTPIDLGHVRDDPALIRDRLNQGATLADVILTSGGASAGDEDHISSLLRNEGTLSSWRIAMKPGRPLALALWQGIPVFGLPGNRACLRAHLRAPGVVVDGGRGLAETTGLRGARGVQQIQEGGPAGILAGADRCRWACGGFRLGRVGQDQRIVVGDRPGRTAGRGAGGSARNTGLLPALWQLRDVTALRVCEGFSPGGSDRAAPVLPLGSPAVHDPPRCRNAGHPQPQPGQW